jgi:hypothetical protein
LIDSPFSVQEPIYLYSNVTALSFNVPYFSIVTFGRLEGDTISKIDLPIPSEKRKPTRDKDGVGVVRLGAVDFIFLGDENQGYRSRDDDN